MEKKQILETYLRRLVREEINKITEEKHISDVVFVETNRVAEELKRNVYQKYSRKLNNSKYGVVSDRFETEIFGLNITVKYDVLHYYNFDIYDKIVDETIQVNDSRLSNPQSAATINTKDKILYIACVYIDEGFQDNSIYGSLQHEIEHLYQTVKSGKESLLTTKKSGLYNIIVQVVNDNTANEYERRLADIAYLTFNEEQCGILNNIYATVMLLAKSPSSVKNIALSSDGYKQIYNSYSSLMWLEKNRNNENVLKALGKRFNGKDVDWFIDNGRKAIGKINNNLKVILNKAENDIRKKLN